MSKAPIEFAAQLAAWLVIGGAAYLFFLGLYVLSAWVF